MPDFLVTHRNSRGQLINPLDELYLLDYTLPLNTSGVATIHIPSSYDFSLIHDYDRLRIERQGIIEGDTDWFVLIFGYEEDTNGREYIKIVAFSALWLITGPINRYPAGDAYSTFSNEYADDAIKRLVRENIGANATDTTRTIPSDLFSVQSPTKMGPTDSKSYSNRRISDVMREVADKNRVYYDVVLKNSTDLEFQTFYPYRGTDKRNIVKFSKEKKNLVRPSYMFDYSKEYTKTYAGGRGEQDTRDMGSATAERHSHPWARAREGFTTSFDSDVNEEAAYLLAANVPFTSISGDIVDTEEVKYGDHWKRGDVVTIEHKGLSVAAEINKVRVVYRYHKENISATIKSV